MTDVFRHMISHGFERCWDAAWSLKLFDARYERNMRSEKSSQEDIGSSFPTSYSTNFRLRTW